MLKLKKVGETTRSFLNQIPYDYTVEVMNRIKRLDLVDRVPEELWTEVHNILEEVVTKAIYKKKKIRRQLDCLGGLTDSSENKRGKGK